MKKSFLILIVLFVALTGCEQPISDSEDSADYWNESQRTNGLDINTKTELDINNKTEWTLSVANAKVNGVNMHVMEYTSNTKGFGLIVKKPQGTDLYEIVLIAHRESLPYSENEFPAIKLKNDKGIVVFDSFNATGITEKLDSYFSYRNSTSMNSAESANLKAQGCSSVVLNAETIFSISPEFSNWLKIYF